MTKTHDLYNLALRDRDMLPTIAIGAAGTGKTYGGIGAAVEWLKTRSRQLIVTRPNVSFADKNGFLPGSEREKMGPWVRPIEQNLRLHGVSVPQQESWEKHGTLQFLPLEYIQGLTFDNAFILCDEVQNMTFEQLKVLLTRQGKYSKLVLCGDIAQISPRFQGSGLAKLIDMVRVLDLNVHLIEFTHEDILRSKQCAEWIKAFDKYEDMYSG